MKIPSEKVKGRMAKSVEKKASELEKENYELVTMSITNSCKAVLVFKKAQ